MIRYISLSEYVWLAEQVTGIEAAGPAKAARIDLADSALHAPSAGFGGEEFYPDIIVTRRSSTRATCGRAPSRSWR